MTTLHKLYLIRFSLIACAILFFLPIVVINIGFGEHLLGGLFDLPSGSEMFWAVCFAYLLSFSALITLRITLLYGPERCGFPKPTGPRFIESQRASLFLFVVALLLPMPLIANTLRVPIDGSQLLGGILGLVTAFVIVFCVDFAQRLFNTFHNSDRPDTAKNLFFPFSNPLSTIAEKTDLPRYFFERRAFARLDKFLQDLNPKYGLGFLYRDSKPVTVHPGIVLATVMLGVYMSIYLLGFYFWSRPLKDGDLPLDVGITTITYVFVLITLLCWLLAGTAFLFDRFRFPTVLVVLVVLAFTQIDHNYDVWEMKGALPVTSTPADLIEARKNDKYIILVTANGGGIQAAAWTTEVLTRFDEECRNIDLDYAHGCKNAIALISGVSGGSLGTMYFVEGYDPNPHPENANERIRAYSQRSSLNFVGGGLVFNDLIRNIPGIKTGSESDRGKHLARGWIDNKKRIDCEYLIKQNLACDGTNTALPATQLNGRLSDWSKSLIDRKRPAVIFNSTIVESGKRLLFTTTRFQSKQMEGSDWITFRDFAGDSRDIDIVEAVRMSASFPFVTPAANMRDGSGFQQHHIVDGGYFDNYGLMSVRDFVGESFDRVEFDDKALPKIIIIQVYGDEVLKKPEVANAEQSLSWLTQIYAPLGTLLSVRQSGQYSRNQEACRGIENIISDRSKNLELYHFVFKYSKRNKETNKNESAPLSWHLTANDRSSIDKASAEMRNPTNDDGNSHHWQRLMKLIQKSAFSQDRNTIEAGDPIQTGCL